MNILHKIITIFFVILGTQVYSQVCLGDDTTVCVGSSVSVVNCSGTPGNNQGIILNNAGSVSLSDDQFSGVVNIGFSFDFYGTTYTQCVIGSNGVVSFNLGNANGYCPWSLDGTPLPNTNLASAMNSMMPAYHDMNPNPGTSPTGEILYETIGVAPFRQFVILYKDIYAFGGGGECSYMGVIMNETDNSFEFHIGYKPIAAGWNNGLAIQGSEDATGTIAHITPGRNNTQWNATQEAKLWTPDSPANTMNYTISDIPYVLITSPNSTFQWEDTDGNTYPYNNGVVTVNNVGLDTVGYFLAGQACGNGLGGVTDTTFINGVQSSVSASGTDDLCSASLGEVTATPTGGLFPFDFDWPALGSTNQTVSNITAGTYTVNMTDAMGCVSTDQVTIGDTPAAFQGSTTLVSCPGGNDGTAFAEMVPELGNISYQWDAAANNQTSQTAVNLMAGDYTCTITSDIGCSGDVTVTVSEIPGMIGNIISQSDVTCNSGSNGEISVSISQGTEPYSYSWDNSSSTDAIASDLFAGTNTVTITDANGCMISVTGVINEPPPLNITFITPDTQICPESDIELSATGSGGSSPYIFTWYENGVLLGTGENIIVDPLNDNTTYCVELSEACGSPIDQECTLIYFPTEINPSALPDETEKCLPGAFEFENKSSNIGEIQSTLWEFGDGLWALEYDGDSTSHEYNQVGVFDVIMTVTSIYGCVYVDTLKQLVEVKPNPIADFTFSTNPTTIFNSTVVLQERFSPDVVIWDWYSPGSIPSSSNLEDPTFTFPQEVGYYPITLSVETERGCVDTLTLVLQIVDDILFYAPNSFTPDNDEFNQTWGISIMGIDIYDFELYIFNRWGETIWESHDPEGEWDGTYNGKKVETGTYSWVARVKSPYDDSKQTFNGFINVLR